MLGHAPSLPTDRYDRNFDLTSIYRNRSCGRVGRHSCLSRDANNSVGGAAVTFVISMAECFRVLLSWHRLLAPRSFFYLIVKGPWWNRDDRRGDGIADMNATPGRSVVSRLSEGHANSRPSFLFFFPPFLLLHLFRFLLSRLCEIRSRRRSAALKLRAGNGSRRPGAKCVRALSDRDSGGAVALFLSCPRAVYRSHCSRASLTKKDLCNFNHRQRLFNDNERQQ